MPLFFIPDDLKSMTTSVWIVMIAIALILLVGVGVLVWYYYIRPVPRPPTPPGGCTTDNQCPAGQRCVNGICVAPTGCTSDNQCRPVQSCAGGTCVPRQCTENSQCSNGISPSSSLCINGTCQQKTCNNDMQCAYSTESCVNGLCYARRQGCTNNNDCYGGTLRCVPQSGRCVP